METLALVIAILVMLIGIAGSILPVLPGIPLIFFAILGYGWYEGFQVITVGYIAIMGGITILSILVDFAAGVWGAQRAGSSTAGKIGALLGVVIGIFTGPLGILIGPFIGAFIGEYLVLRNWERAVNVAFATVVGVFAGSAVKLLLGLIMMLSFLFKVF